MKAIVFGGGMIPESLEWNVRCVRVEDEVDLRLAVMDAVPDDVIVITRREDERAALAAAVLSSPPLKVIAVYVGQITQVVAVGKHQSYRFAT